MRDIETIDSELQLVAALLRAAWDRGGPLPSIDVADALLDERRKLTGVPPDQVPGLSPRGTTSPLCVSTIPRSPMASHAVGPGSPCTSLRPSRHSPDRGVTLVSVTDGIDSSTPAGRMMIGVLGS
jgi:hypothetical protein